jgi:small-conductance mechanosensitive channel/CRP-like cAMP-binding protein
MGLPELFRDPSVLQTSLFGVAAGLLTWFVSRITLRREERRLARLALLLLFLYVLTRVGAAALPDGHAVTKVLRLSALFFLLSSIGRSAFLILVHGLLTRRLGYRVPRILEDITQAGVFIGVSLVALREAGMEPTSLLATSALLTAVLGLSLQETLGNLFAGLAIQGERPFEVNDWIQFDEHRDRIGRVVEINWRATKLETADRVILTVPNGVLARAPIMNFSRPTPLVRRSVQIDVPIDAPPGRVIALLEAAAGSVDGVVEFPPPNALVHEFTERGVRYWIRYHIVDYARREDIAGAVLRNCWYTLQRAGMESPAPRRRVQWERPARPEDERTRLGTPRRLEALERVDLLTPLSSAGRQRLAELSRTELYGAAELVVRQGEEGGDWFIILSGEVSVEIEQGPEPLRVALLGPGEFFGEMSLMTGEPRAATVRVTRECELLVVSRAAFQSALSDEPEVLAQISEVLAQRRAALGERELAESATRARDTAPVLLARIRRFFAVES